MATESWTEVMDFRGDWQPVSGQTRRAEVGRKAQSLAFIIAPCNTNVLAGDRIELPDGSFMYVNYVNVYAGHITIYLVKTKGAN